MNPADLAHELKLFLTSCFQDCYWSAWVLSRDSAYFLDSTCINDLAQEERALVHKVTSLSDSVELPAGHTLLGRNEKITLSSYTADAGKIVVASAQKAETALKICASLLPAMISQWRIKSRLNDLIGLNTIKMDELKRSESAAASGMKSFVEFVMADWKQKQSVQISFEENLADSLIGLLPENIIAQLTEALEIKRFLNASGIYHITQSDLQPVPETKPAYAIVSGSQRAEILLTKYEEAAERAARQGEVINGKTVAAFLRPAISPPAVTDALKKHKREIARLVHQHPDRWKLVRQFLKPVRDLAERSLFE